MSLLLSGSDGVSDVDGTAATPAIRGTDANTGISFGTDTVTISTGGVARVTTDASGNVGVGTVSPTALSSYRTLDVRGGTGGGFRFGNSTDSGYIYSDSNETNIASATSKPLLFSTNATERARIDSSGNLLVGTTSVNGGDHAAAKLHVLNSQNVVSFKTTAASGWTTATFGRNGNNGGVCSFLYNDTTQVGSISITNTTTTYSTSSDYRLKENVEPMTGALEKVAALKPVTYTWKADGSAGQGFIAHELQAVVPDCVSGEKDDVQIIDDLDDDGNKIGTKEVPRYQGVDTSFLVATLVAAIQELKSEFDAYKATHP